MTFPNREDPLFETWGRARQLCEFKPCESSPVPSDILCSLFSLLMPSTLRIFVNYIFYVHYLSINVYCRNILCLFTNGFFMVLFIFVGI